jgi:hypothetical protein
LAQDHQCLIDSLPVPVLQFYLVPGSTGDWKAFGATYGRVSSKKETIFGQLGGIPFYMDPSYDNRKILYFSGGREKWYVKKAQ